MTRGALRAAGIAVLAGFVGAVLWWAVAPRPRVVVRSDGVFFRDPDPEQFAAADAWFGIVAFVVGVGVGLLVWRLVRREPRGAVLGLAGGGILGAFVMRQLGQWLGRADLQEIGRRPVGTVATAPLRLQSSGLLLVLPVAALAAWLVCDLVSDYRDARSGQVGHDGDGERAVDLREQRLEHAGRRDPERLRGLEAVRRRGRVVDVRVDGERDPGPRERDGRGRPGAAAAAGHG